MMEQDGLKGRLQKISLIEVLEASNQGRAGDAPSLPSYTWDCHRKFAFVATCAVVKV